MALGKLITSYVLRHHDCFLYMLQLNNEHIINASSKTFIYSFILIERSCKSMILQLIILLVFYDFTFIILMNGSTWTIFTT